MIYFITGGERSGKSRYAQQLAIQLSDRPVYVATARKWDSVFEGRIQRHRQDRDDRWTTLEEEKRLDRVDLCDRVAVIDCVTLWLTNFFVDNNGDAQLSLDEAKTVFDNMRVNNSIPIFVSNEIGMGVHAPSERVRKFVELHGWMNQYIASLAEHVVFMVSGIPVKIKCNGHVKD